MVYFLWVSCLGIFLHRYKALSLFVHERRHCLNLSSLVSSHVSPLFCLCKNRLTALLCSPLCSAMQFTQVHSYSEVVLAWSDVTLDTEANSIFLWKYPYFPAAGGIESKRPRTNHLDQLYSRNWHRLFYSLVLIPNTHLLLPIFFDGWLEFTYSTSVSPLSCGRRIKDTKTALQPLLVLGPRPSVACQNNNNNINNSRESKKSQVSKLGNITN